VVLLVFMFACTGATKEGRPAATTGPPARFARVADPSLLPSYSLASVHAILGASGDDPDWLIVGSMFEPVSRSTTAAVWASRELRDGWTRTDLAPGEPERDETLHDITRSGASRIAVGAVGSGEDADALVVVDEGDSWTRVTDRDLEDAGEETMTGVAAGPGALVAIGSGRDEDGETSPRIWVSDDGFDWQLMAGAWSNVFDRSDQESVAAVAGGPGEFVVVGSEVVGERSDGVAWFSPDGRSWRRAEVPGQLPERRESLLGVTAHGSTFVATGFVADDRGQGVPASWVSTDGLVWTGPSLAFPLIDDGRYTTEDLTASSVSSDGTTLVAGTGNGWRPHVWTSSDGVGWAVQPTFMSEPDYLNGIDLTEVVVAGGALGVLSDSPLLLYAQGNRWVAAQPVAPCRSSTTGPRCGGWPPMARPRWPWEAAGPLPDRPARHAHWARRGSATGLGPGPPPTAAWMASSLPWRTTPVAGWPSAWRPSTPLGGSEPIPTPTARSGSRRPPPPGTGSAPPARRHRR
jgi:hypothetical protein